MTLFGALYSLKPFPTTPNAYLIEGSWVFVAAGVISF